jgi:hypothetical protein
MKCFLAIYNLELIQFKKSDDNQQRLYTFVSFCIDQIVLLF